MTVRYNNNFLYHKELQGIHIENLQSHFFCSLAVVKYYAAFYDSFPGITAMTMSFKRHYFTIAMGDYVSKLYPKNLQDITHIFNTFFLCKPRIFNRNRFAWHCRSVILTVWHISWYHSSSKTISNLLTNHVMIKCLSGSIWLI